LMIKNDSDYLIQICMYDTIMERSLSAIISQQTCRPWGLKNLKGTSEGVRSI